MQKFIARWKHAALLGMALVTVLLALTQDVDLALRIGVWSAIACFAGLVGLEVIAQMRRSRRQLAGK